MPAFALKLIVESSINTSDALETEIPNSPLSWLIVKPEITTSLDLTSIEMLVNTASLPLILIERLSTILSTPTLEISPLNTNSSEVTLLNRDPVLSK